MKVIDEKTLIEKIKNWRKSSPYLAMYSSVFDALIIETHWMLAPIDDHMFHRGDGVFEALKMIDSKLYDLKSHLQRLERSAKAIELDLPMPLEEIQEKVIQTARATGVQDCGLRIYVSRGPGSLSANPYDCIGSQLYIVAETPKPYPEKLFIEGAKVGISRFEAKRTPFCNIKSCNYLLNVLLKKEAVDAGIDYMIPLDEHALVTEGSTENVAMLSKKGEFLAPRFDRTLQGTTLTRVMQLAQDNLKELGLTKVQLQDLTVSDFKEAREIFIIGTTMGVMPVQKFDTTSLNAFKDPSNLWQKLKKLLDQDRRENQNFLSLI